jgi:hypothetical protein
MKVRIYSPLLPYPVSEGAFQVIFEQVLGFAKFHDVELVTWKEPSEEIQKKLAGKTFASVFGPKVQLVHWETSQAKETKSQRISRTLKSLLMKDSSTGLYYYPLAQDHRDRLGPCDLAIYHYTYAWSWLRQATKTQEKKKVLYFHNIESDLHDYRADCEPKSFQRWIHRQNAKKNPLSGKGSRKSGAGILAYLSKGLHGHHFKKYWKSSGAIRPCADLSPRVFPRAFEGIPESI